MLGHYYTSDPADCASRKAAASPRDASERPVGAVAYEGIAFFVHLPNDGVCPLGTTPIYRMRKDDRDVVPNYRFITTRSARRELGAKGWSMDPQSVAFLCGAPPMALSRHLPAGY